jgi:hypothetical protein
MSCGGFFPTTKLIKVFQLRFDELDKNKRLQYKDDWFKYKRLLEMACMLEAEAEAHLKEHGEMFIDEEVWGLIYHYYEKL